MKKLIYYALIMLFVNTACSKEDLIVPQEENFMEHNEKREETGDQDIDDPIPTIPILKSQTAKTELGCRVK